MIHMKYDIEVIRSNRRTVSISITKEGKVLVRAPYNLSNWQLRKLLHEKGNWIEKHLQKLTENQDAFAKQDEISSEEDERLTEEEHKMYIKEARRLFTERTNHYAPIVGVTYNRIAIKSQKTRWGSCSSKGNLNFNYLLYFAPLEILDYVVVHELCHRKEMNHSKAFWAEVEKIIPDYKQRRKWLREHGRELEGKRYK